MFPKSPTPSLLISPRTFLQSWSSPRPTLLSPFTTKTLCSTLPLVSSGLSNIISADSSDVYALEVAGGGDACIGHIGHSHSDDAHSHAASSTSVAPAASTTVASASATSAAVDIPAPPAESTGCVLHNDHYDCEGPASATSAAAAAEQTGDCHTHADGGKPKIPC
jgi:hypothetical protein